MKNYIKNTAVIIPILLFQFLVIWDIISVLYIVSAESGISFVHGYSYVEGLIMVGVATVVMLILNLILIICSFTRLRTTTVAIPFCLFIAGAIYIFFFGGYMFFVALGPLGWGAMLGFIYSILFYWPPIWFYFRFRWAYIAVGWASILFLVRLLIANYTKIDGSEIEQATALLRPDYLFITGVYYFTVSLLFIFDHSQAASRWVRTPQKPLKLPFLRTILPVGVILGLVVIATNLCSPVIWKTIHDHIEQTRAEAPTEEDLPENPDNGPAGNLKENGEDKVQMDPNQELQDELDQSGGAGNSILFSVSAEKSNLALSDREKPIRYYWKMETMDAFSDERGFYNDFRYDDSTYERELQYGRSYEYLDTGTKISTEEYGQIITFYELETNWIIGHDAQDRIRLLTGDERSLYKFENGTTVSQANKPFYKGDSYEIVSEVSLADIFDREEGSLLFNLYLYDNVRNETKYNQENWKKIESKYNQFDDDQIYNLASEVTMDHTKRLDKVLAVQDYLHANYTYDLKPGGPDGLEESTRGMDRLKYFLFENKKGYCTYFASAMVAMLRSQGIPARVAGGFAEGTYSEELGAYVVTGNDAHAWVEVFFNKYGWITFDPTPAASEEQQQEREEQLEQELNEERKEELKDLQEDAQEQKEQYDNIQNNPTQTYEPEEEYVAPEWMQDFSEWLQIQIAILLELMKYVIVLCCGGLIILLLTVPPAWNTLIDLSLAGRIQKRKERDQIISYFKLIERKMGKYDPTLRRKHTETALEYYDRLKVTFDQLDENMSRSLGTACNIYNRAVFRHQLEEGDDQKMQDESEKVVTWIQNQMDAWKVVKGLWWV